MDYQILFSDIDGTFFTPQSGYIEKSVHRIREMVELGGRFVIASGRASDSAVYLVRHELGLESSDGCSICLNGAHIIENRNKKTLHTVDLPMHVVKTVFDACREVDLRYHCYTEDYVYFDFESENIAYFHQIVKAKTRVVDNIARDIDGHPLKIIANGIYYLQDEQSVRDIHRRLVSIKEQLEPVIGQYVDIQFSSAAVMEFTSKSAGKGQGLKFLADYYGIPAGDTVAIGDGENDISMLREAGIGIAAANATDAVKQAADKVTAATCEEGAVAEVIEEYFIR